MGSVISFITQTFPPKSKFSVIIVTGANSGTGKETVKALLQHNAKVYVAARNPASAKIAIDDLKAQTGKQAEFLELDLADLHSIKRAVEEFTKKETQLHAPPIEQLTAQKYDLTFGTNVLGKPARVVNTASTAAELFGEDINYNTLRDSPARKKAGANKLYFQSKFMRANELWRRYGDQGIVSVALNPGNLKSGLQRHLVGSIVSQQQWILYPTSYGALTQLWAGTTDVGATFGGKYLIPWARVGTNPSANPTSEKALWTWLEEQVQGI
ncbi:NAD(P)-binding protein [Mycena polygramma]|nr:NAD(P)-binding protein [Mycena polygramma]